MDLPSKAEALVLELSNASTTSEKADLIMANRIENLGPLAEIKASGLIDLLLRLGNPPEAQRLSVCQMANRTDRSLTSARAG